MNFVRKKKIEKNGVKSHKFPLEWNPLKFERNIIKYKLKGQSVKRVMKVRKWQSNLHIRQL